MKTFLFSIILFLISITVVAQDKFQKDIDFDGVVDTVYIDLNTSTIVCLLSSKQFQKVESKPIDLTNRCLIKDAKNGFYFENHWMRSGHSAQFRYDKKTKKIRLIGMSRYSFGNAANNGSGESSVNLLTGDYIGNWNYYDLAANNNEGKLIKIPTIKTKMFFNKIYLEDFDEGISVDYTDQCSELYYKHRDQLKKQRE
ncbi:hypothetical protein [Aquimarina litoralis]|uniref:hypothetical protein n=1 Tax=Aquimarina litoralis TaxID=584605 RepID=UPI001C5669A0|nr:hypothetical protein [Aquimarina litoralis]MBW1297919.1 hypothetical protein [Aquimarina litoralis]